MLFSNGAVAHFAGLHTGCMLEVGPPDRRSRSCDWRAAFTLTRFWAKELRGDVQSARRGLLACRLSRVIGIRNRGSRLNVGEAGRIGHICRPKWKLPSLPAGQKVTLYITFLDETHGISSRSVACVSGLV